jgi:hypothetical protein
MSEAGGRVRAEEQRKMPFQLHAEMAFFLPAPDSTRAILVFAQTGLRHAFMSHHVQDPLLAVHDQNDTK